jgi:tetratricopeptide (TPR) repeat protein
MRILHPAVSKWCLPTRGRRFLFLAAAGVVALLPAFEAARLATAIILGASTDPAQLQRALVLDPADAGVEHRLGLTLFYSASGTPPERAQGLDHLRRATAYDPYEALYWSDLASACEASRDVSCADDAVKRALDSSPMTPRLYWSAANYSLRTGRQAQALVLFERLLDLDPSYAEPVFRICLRMLGSPESAEQKILAENRNPHVAAAFLNLASGLGDDDSAYAEWQHVVSAGGAGLGTLSLAELEPYLDHLIDAGRQNDALTVWSDLERLGVVAPPDSGKRAESASYDGAAPAQLVFNGGFERNPLNAGLDWRYNPEPFVAVTLSDVASHGGSNSLQIEFTGDRNQEYEPVFEIVPVQPGRSYLLAGFVRSQAITSDTGPRLRVRDPACLPSSSSCLDASSADTISTTPWHPVGLSFTTGPGTRFVRLSIWRPRSRGYPAEISGMCWVDDVLIAEQALEGALAPRR